MMITTQVYSRTYFEHPNQLIVATKKDAKSLIEQVFDKDLSELIQAKKIGAKGFYLLSGSPTLELKKFLNDFKNRDGVEWAAPNRVYLENIKSSYQMTQFILSNFIIQLFRVKKPGV